jgi:hypothetical protein
MASSPTTEKVIPYAPARNDGGHRPSGCGQFSVARARLHCEHDGEYRASRVCNGARIRTVHRTLVNGTLGISCRGDTRRTGHSAGECRFTDSICGTSVPPGGGFSVCCVVLRHRIPRRSARRFYSTVCSDRLDGARDGHTQCRCPETRYPGSDDNGPDFNDYGIGADSSLANGNNPRLARRVVSVAAMFLGAALGAIVIHYSISAALWLATVISAVCSAALFRSLRTCGSRLSR